MSSFVSFYSDASGFCVSCSFTDPTEAAEVLGKLSLVSADAAEAATRLILAHSGSRLVKGWTSEEWSYVFEKVSTWFVTVKHREKILFSGPLGLFCAWARKWTGYEFAAQKIVRFTYNGGVDTGKVRTVLISKVERLNGQVSLLGVDLDKQEIRRYRADRVVGDIHVMD